jgi:carboxypeptidase Taq
MNKAWNDLLPRLRELADLGSAGALLQWDQAVMMPPGGGASRARALSTVESVFHERLTDPAIGDLLEELRAADDLDQDQGASVRVLAHDYEKATKVPEDLVRALAEAKGLAYIAWTEARPAPDFSLVAKELERLIDLKKEEADALGWEDDRYDPLLDYYEPGMKTAEVAAMFEDLVDGLKPVVDAVLGVIGDAPEFLSSSYDVDRQTAFCQWLAEKVGFAADKGRIDTSPHPFTMPVSAGDIRQTTLADDRNLLMSVYAVMHETGHALYEQGIPDEMRDLPVGRHPSLGMHESQSRLWENQVGRSRPFTDFLLPHLKERFPQEIGMASPDDFYRGVNHVRRSYIRITADELTYNLHVALRFELEYKIFRDELSVPDLPDAWDAAMEKHLGIRPDSQANGVLQDMHWTIGHLGYFPTYTIGNIYGAAFYDKALADLGDISEEMRSGDTTRLLEWLREHIHREAYRYDAKELAARVTGGPVTPKPLLDYLTEKYSDLYDLSV